MSLRPAGERVAGLVLVDLLLPLVTVVIQVVHGAQFRLQEPVSVPCPAWQWGLKGLFWLLDLPTGVRPVRAGQRCRAPVAQQAGLILVLHTGEGDGGRESERKRGGS